MPRSARCVLAGIPHHVTQRGNHRAPIFSYRRDRFQYLKVLRESCEKHGVSILAYCLMTNHTHLVVIPEESDSLALGIGRAHQKYASRYNFNRSRCGHLFQNRFYSCALDPIHLWVAVRYVEQNPVRAGLVIRAEDYPWSSASAHCKKGQDSLLSQTFPPSGVIKDWSSWVNQPLVATDLESIREFTANGRPLDLTSKKS